MLSIFLAMTVAQTADVDSVRVRIAIELALQAQTKRGEQSVIQRTYADAYTEAVQRSLPLVVGIGVDPPRGSGWVTFRREAPWQEWRRPAIVVSVPKGDTLWQLKTLPATASWDDVFDVLAGHEGQKHIDRRASSVGPPHC